MYSTAESEITEEAGGSTFSVGPFIYVHQFLLITVLVSEEHTPASGRDAQQYSVQSL